MLINYHCLFLLFFALPIASPVLRCPTLTCLEQGIGPSDASGVSIAMVPTEAEAPTKGAPWKVGSEVRVKVMATNNSNELTRVVVVDPYYQNHPQLYKKNGELVPYREETAKLVRYKERNPHFTRVGSLLLLQPTTTTKLEELNLADWYEPLEPSVYRLINRYRLEVRGHWTADSEELLFEVAEP